MDSQQLPMKFNVYFFTDAFLSVSFMVKMPPPYLISKRSE